MPLSSGGCAPFVLVPARRQCTIADGLVEAADQGKLQAIRKQGGASPSQMAKAPADLRSLARAHTELGIQTLAGIARNSTSDTARVQAVGMLLDRGWGKAPQPHTGEDDKDIRVTIRTITEGAPPMPLCRVLRPA